MFLDGQHDQGPFEITWMRRYSQTGPSLRLGHRTTADNSAPLLVVPGGSATGAKRYIGRLVANMWKNVQQRDGGFRQLSRGSGDRRVVCQSSC